MTAPPEFARPVRLDTIGAGPRAIEIEADVGERAALAERFGLIGIARLTAALTLLRDGDTVSVTGRIVAAATQACVATGDPVPALVDEAFVLRFVPGGSDAAEELELDEGDLDVVGYDGSAIDVGEAVAQGFSLALDPFPRCADAGAHLRAAGVLSEEEAEAERRDASPFAVLKGLKPD